MTAPEIMTYLQGIRWPNGVISPYRATAKVYVHPIPNTFVCKWHNRQFTVLTGTLLANSRKTICEWYKLVEMIVNKTPEVDIAAELQLTDTTIYGMYRRIFVAYDLVVPKKNKDLYRTLVKYIARKEHKADDVFRRLMKDRRKIKIG